MIFLFSKISLLNPRGYNSVCGYITVYMGLNLNMNFPLIDLKRWISNDILFD